MQGIDEVTTSKEIFICRARNLLNEKYEEKYVCFVDVLGYRSELMTSDIPFDVALPNLIFNHMKEANEEKENNLQIVIFSDCAYIVTDKTNVESLLKYLSWLYFEFITSNNSNRYRLLRGGITFGKVYCRPELHCIVGPSVADACQLEDKHFRYPRIIFDKKTLSALSAFTNIYRDIRVDERDNERYLDFVSIVKRNPRFDPEMLNSSLQWITKEAKKQNEDSIKEKYEWMRDYLNEKIKA